MNFIESFRKLSLDVHLLLNDFCSKPTVQLTFGNTNCRSYKEQTEQRNVFYRSWKSFIAYSLAATSLYEMMALVLTLSVSKLSHDYITETFKSIQWMSVYNWLQFGVNQIQDSLLILANIFHTCRHTWGTIV